MRVIGIARRSLNVAIDSKRAISQSLAADGAVAWFSSNLFLLSLEADRAPQLKRVGCG